MREQERKKKRRVRTAVTIAFTLVVIGVVIGIMFVLSSISVIIQVIYYKKTKKRVFLMAPLHHHFQKKGYSEAKIAYVYSLVTALAGLLCIFFV